MTNKYEVKEGLLSSFTKWTPEKKDIDWTVEALNTMQKKTGKYEFDWVTSWYSLHINMKEKTVQWVEMNCAPQVIESSMDNLSRCIKVLEKIGFKSIASDNIINNTRTDKRLLPGGKVIDQSFKIPGKEGDYGH